MSRPLGPCTSLSFNRGDHRTGGAADRCPEVGIPVLRRIDSQIGTGEWLPARFERDCHASFSKRLSPGARLTDLADDTARRIADFESVLSLHEAGDGQHWRTAGLRHLEIQSPGGFARQRTRHDHRDLSAELIIDRPLHVLVTLVSQPAHAKRGTAERVTIVRLAIRTCQRRSDADIAGPSPTIEKPESRWIPRIGEPSGRRAQTRVVSDDSPPSRGTP